MTLLEELMAGLTRQKNQIVSYKASVSAIIATCCDKKAALENVVGPSELVVKMIAECTHEENVLNGILQEKTDMEANVDAVLALSSGDQVILGEILDLLANTSLLMDQIQQGLVKSGFDSLKAEYNSCVNGSIPSELTVMILQSCISRMLN